MVIEYGFIKEGVLQPSVLECLIVQFKSRAGLVMSPHADAPASESTAEATRSHPRKDLAQMSKKGLKFL